MEGSAPYPDHLLNIETYFQHEIKRYEAMKNKWTKEDWIKNTGWSAPFSAWVKREWEKTSERGGFAEIADTIKSNILNKKISNNERI